MDHELTFIRDFPVTILLGQLVATGAAQWPGDFQIQFHTILFVDEPALELNYTFQVFPIRNVLMKKLSYRHTLQHALMVTKLIRPYFSLLAEFPQPSSRRRV